LQEEVYSKLFDLKDIFLPKKRIVEGGDKKMIIYCQHLEKVTLLTIEDFLFEAIKQSNLDVFDLISKHIDYICPCCVSMMQRQPVNILHGYTCKTPLKKYNFEWNRDAPRKITEKYELKFCKMHAFLGGCDLIHCNYCRVCVYDRDGKAIYLIATYKNRASKFLGYVQVYCEYFRLCVYDRDGNATSNISFGSDSEILGKWTR
jgi:hypothetical protein